jgi:carboxyl-terminal processing protease
MDFKKNMIKFTSYIALLLTSLIVLASFSCGSHQAEASTISIEDLLAAPTGDNKQSKALQIDIANRVRRALTEAHFAPQTIDDSFSIKVFEKFIDQCDFGKVYFTKQDIAEFSAFKTKLDDQFLDDDISFYELVYDRFKIRLEESKKCYTAAIAKSQNFASKKTIQLDGKKLNWCADKKEVQERWADVVTYRVLAKYAELVENQNNKKDTVKNWKVMSNVVLEDSARKMVKKNMDLNFKRIQKNGSDEYFASYINAICSIFDPHTDYYAPAKKKEFDVQMSGTFFGIGAVLKDVDGYCTIQEIKAGTPCYLQGSLKVDDKILKIGQGTEEPVEVVGWDITNEVIPLIRGKKGTEVRLYVKHTNGTEETIPIIRGEIHMDEVFAKSSIIKEGNKKIGYIHLPEFYADFQNENGKRCAADMRKEVEKLKAEGVDGMMIDLRYNGGGSLSDVVDIAGLFVGDGPIVQVKSKDAKGKPLPAIGAKILYDGPLAILINNYSASASEILAAAMQDYNRAIIVGTNTYGKGTVQQQIDLARVAPSSNGEMGSIKLTLQKFYRVNGGSTQRKGVVPDVVLPEYLMYTDKGERSEASALPYDEIASPNYRKTNSIDVATIVADSKKRIAADNYFKIVEQRAQQIKQQQDDNVYSLNEKTYTEQIKKLKEFNSKLEDLDKEKVSLEMYNPATDMQKISENDVTKKRNEDWLKVRKKDANIKETVNILTAIINTKK